VGDEMLLVAIGCGRLPGIIEIAARSSFVVFGTMDGERLAGMANHITNRMGFSCPVYFYETG
jgi:hypothetical protein